MIGAIVSSPGYSTIGKIGTGVKISKEGRVGRYPGYLGIGNYLEEGTIATYYTKA